MVRDLSGNNLTPIAQSGSIEEHSAVSGAAITASDSAANNFSRPTRGVYVGGAGNVAVVFPDDSVAVFQAVPAGYILPVQAIRINSTSTTATNMVAMF